MLGSDGFAGSTPARSSDCSDTRPRKDKRMELLNCTPHVLNIFNTNGESITIEPCGEVARVNEKEKCSGHCRIMGVHLPFRSSEAIGVVGLPEPKQGIIYVVSKVVADHIATKHVYPYRKREDICSPGPLKRNESGQPVGCIGLSFPVLYGPFDIEAYGDGHRDRGLFNLGTKNMLHECEDVIEVFRQHGDPCWEEFWARVKSRNTELIITSIKGEDL
jgi:hypothetical protein